MKIIKRIVLTILSIILWGAFIGYGFIDGFLLKPITTNDNAISFIEATKSRLKSEFVGNLAMSIIENGEISENYYFSIDEPVDEFSIFQVASISKWVTSFGVMKLVEEGKIKLDQPVDIYLTRWHLPPSEYDNSKVTVRRLLSHTAGLVDDLGYSGYTGDQKIQTIEESLTKASDGNYSEGIAKVGIDPGSVYMYSGAGYTILQLLIEEVTGQSFQQYMTENVFLPLDMNHSTFVLSEKQNIKEAQLFQNDGTIGEPIRFTALAAASLYTCTEDLSKFLLANVSRNNVLTSETISNMSYPQAFINDIGVYGLGPHLYSQGRKNSLIIGHDGSGSSVNTAARIDLKSKNGIIILEMGNHDFASSMADEWLFWSAGIADYVVMQRNLPYLFKIFAFGALFIIGVSTYLTLRKN